MRIDLEDRISGYEGIKVLIKFHQEFEQFYDNVFIPEYQKNSVFTEPYIGKNGVFKLILKRVISDLEEYLYDEDDIFGEDDQVKSGIISINQLPSFSKFAPLKYNRRNASNFSNSSSEKLQTKYTYNLLCQSLELISCSKSLSLIFGLVNITIFYFFLICYTF